MPIASFDRRAIPAGARFSTWPAPDGWPYRLLHWPREEGKAARGSLLFANGRGDFVEKYVEADAWWHEKGWDVTAFDWRGQGGSQGDIRGGHLDSFDPLIADLDALIADWRARTPGPHVVVGHSMGGHLLLRALVDRKPPVDAAVLVAPMIRINSGALPHWMAAATAATMCALGFGRVPAWHVPKTPAAPGSFRQSILTGSRERFEDELWWWTQHPEFNLYAPTWGWLHAAYLSCAQLGPERLRKVETPILLIGTDRDRLVSAPAIREAAAALPDAELLMFANAAHEILREADAVRIRAFERIDAFFDAHAR